MVVSVREQCPNFDRIGNTDGQETAPLAGFVQHFQNRGAAFRCNRYRNHSIIHHHHRRRHHHHRNSAANLHA